MGLIDVITGFFRRENPPIVEKNSTKEKDTNSAVPEETDLKDPNSEKETNVEDKKNKVELEEQPEKEKNTESKKTFLKKAGELIFGRSTVENLSNGYAQKNKKDMAKGMLKLGIMLAALIAIPILASSVLPLILAPLGIAGGLVQTASVMGGLGVAIGAGKMSRSIGMNKEDRLKNEVSDIAATVREKEIKAVQEKQEKTNVVSNKKLKMTGIAVAAVVILPMIFPPLAPILGGLKILAMIFGGGYAAKTGYDKLVKQPREIENIKTRPFTEKEIKQVQSKLTPAQQEYIKTKNLVQTEQEESQAKGSIKNLTKEKLEKTQDVGEKLTKAKLKKENLTKSEEFPRNRSSSLDFRR